MEEAFFGQTSVGKDSRSWCRTRKVFGSVMFVGLGHELLGKYCKHLSLSTLDLGNISSDFPYCTMPL